MQAETRSQGTSMAEQKEPILDNPPTQEFERHVRDYSLMISMLKWGSIVALVVVFFVLLIIS
jgi:hypothetical protein